MPCSPVTSTFCSTKKLQNQLEQVLRENNQSKMHQRYLKLQELGKFLSTKHLSQIPKKWEVCGLSRPLRRSADSAHITLKKKKKKNLSFKKWWALGSPKIMPNKLKIKIVSTRGFFKKAWKKEKEKKKNEKHEQEKRVRHRRYLGLKEYCSTNYKAWEGNLWERQCQRLPFTVFTLILDLQSYNFPNSS